LDDIRAQVPGGTRISFQLRPPTFQGLLGDKKMAFGPRRQVALRTLARLKFLRGTALDPFGRAEVRRTERAILAHYRGLLEQLAGELSVESYDRACRLAELPDVVRGYESVKMRNVELYREQLRAEGVAVPF
jgi:indolepyruvate ferredoxin oxidoreductase